MMDNPVRDKSKVFAVHTTTLYRFLCDTRKEFILSKQMLRSGTSIGANVIEAICRISKKEFLAKMYISFKECSETKYWLEILHESGYLSEEEFSPIYKECNELYLLLSSITRSTRQNLSEED